MLLFLLSNVSFLVLSVVLQVSLLNGFPKVLLTCPKQICM